MKTNELGDKILDSAIELMVFSLSGVPTDNDTKQAYKALATDLILSPTKSIKREIPRRLRMLRGKYEQASTWLH